MKQTVLFIAASAVALATAVAATAQHLPSGPAEPLPLKEFMGHVVQRNAEQLWHWSASEIDQAGERSNRPQADAEWENAESDALTLQQLASVLDASPYRIDDPRWARHAQALRAAATASASAAEQKDYAAFETANNTVNEQCIACHLTFAPELEWVPPSI